MSRIVESVRMPITVVQGYLELLQDGALGSMSEEQMTTMKMLLQRTRQVAVAVNQLSPSRFLPGASRYESIRLTDLMRHVLEERNAEIRLAGLNLVAELPPPEGQEYATAGDPDSLLDVFGALLDNAIESSPSGGTIQVSLHESSQIIYVRINDLGVGIPPNRLMQIWQPKEQREPSESISLAEVKQIVEEHGGQVWVESQLGQGSTFYVVLPKVAGDAVSQRHASRGNVDGPETGSLPLPVDVSATTTSFRPQRLQR
jgi:two-component system sensor histidine kinase ResE